MTDNQTGSNALARKAADLASQDKLGGGFLDLLAQATDLVRGRTVVTASHMVGIPFIITGITYREGKGGDYVSLEATCADAGTLNNLLNKGRIVDQEDKVYATIDMLPIYPNEEIVINDSGTGIRRQMTQYLYDVKGLIVPDLKWDFEAHQKTSVFDQPTTAWLEGAEDALAGITGLRFLCMKGTQISKYEYKGDTARTAYLA